jgi:hypothetical protein
MPGSSGGATERIRTPAHASQPVSLHFVMNNVDVYSIRFRE